MTEPSGCRWCGIGQREHCQQWTAEAAWHSWRPPTQDQILDRMLQRRAARIAACWACRGQHWVCENHMQRPWSDSGLPDACPCGGAGAPCPVCNPLGLEPPRDLVVHCER